MHRQTLPNISTTFEQLKNITHIIYIYHFE